MQDSIKGRVLTLNAGHDASDATPALKKLLIGGRGTAIPFFSASSTLFGETRGRDILVHHQPL